MMRPELEDITADRLNYFVKEYTSVPDPDALSFDQKVTMLIEAYGEEVGDPMYSEQQRRAGAPTSTR